MRRPARPRQLELRGVEVDGDDRSRSGESQRGDDLQPHASAADDDRRLACAHARGVGDRAERGDDPAPEE